MGLPFELGVLLPPLSGCFWETIGELFLVGEVGGAGATVPVPILTPRTLNGVVLGNEALLIGGGLEQSTNGFSIGIGQWLGASLARLHGLAQPRVAKSRSRLPMATCSQPRTMRIATGPV